MKYKDGSGSGVLKQNNCDCINISISGSSGNSQVIYTGFPFQCNTLENLPIGLMKVQALLFSDGVCSILEKNGEEVGLNVHDRITSVNANLQILSVNVP